MLLFLNVNYIKLLNMKKLEKRVNKECLLKLSKKRVYKSNYERKMENMLVIMI